MTFSDWRRRRPGDRLIFLSHSGADKDFADLVGLIIESQFFFRGYAVKVFNTSDTQYRFSKWNELSRARDVFKVAAARRNEKLRAYLSENLAASSAYLLLVTGSGLREYGNWVQWEIQEGTALAREHHIPFVSIIIDAEHQFPVPHPPPEATSFQALNLDTTKGDLQMELSKLVTEFLELPLWGKAWDPDPRSGQA